MADFIHLPGYEFPRITLLGSSVNKDKSRREEGSGRDSPLIFQTVSKGLFSEIEGLDECCGLHSVLRGGSKDSKKADFIREIRYLELVSERLC